MSMGDMKTLHEELTQLLMDNGAAVTKPSIDALVHFIAVRDQATTEQIIRETENLLSKLQNDEFYGTKDRGN